MNHLFLFLVSVGFIGTAVIERAYYKKMDRRSRVVHTLIAITTAYFVISGILHLTPFTFTGVLVEYLTPRLMGWLGLN